MDNTRKATVKKIIKEYMEASEERQRSLKRIYAFQTSEYEQSLRLKIKSEAKWRYNFATKYYLTKFLLRYFKIFKL
jgi:hypothetical protein